MWRWTCVLGACFLFLTLSLRSEAQPVPTVSLSAEALAEDSIVLPSVWDFRPEGDTAARWMPVDTRLLPGGAPENWTGLGWFRMTLQVDSALAARPLGMQFRQFGAAEVYLNGELLGRLGKPATSWSEEEALISPNVIGLPLSHTGPQVLTVRYSGQHTEALHAVGYGAGFTASVGVLDAMVDSQAQTIRSATTRQIGLAGMYLTFGLLHLFLFLSYPEMRTHLFFGVVAVCIAVIAFLNYQEALFAHGPEALILIRRLWGPLTILTVLAFLRFIYEVYLGERPRYFRVLAGVGALVALWSWFDTRIGWFDPAGGRTYAYAFALGVQAEMLRAMAGAIYRRRRRAVILGAGVLAFVLAFSYPLLVVLGVFPAIAVEATLTFSFFVLLGLLLSISIYLSFDYARINKELRQRMGEIKELSRQRLNQERQRLEQQQRLRDEEVQRQLLKAEYDLKLKELEEARQLQLSMLPTQMPQHPRLELAAYMETATEVGGDYYDFISEADGTLTIAVGDATGHGMRAGTMVTATKSLFTVLGQKPDLLGILAQCTRALKRMNLRQLYMALTVAKLQGDTLRLTTAGMPPTLVWRAATEGVEVVRLRGMPLGSFVNFPYQQHALTLAPGDTVLFMSDGFPELFSPEGDMLGYDEAVDAFAEIASAAPDAIIAHLVALGRSWTEGQPPDDDMTFVVLKMRVDRDARDGTSPVAAGLPLGEEV